MILRNVLEEFVKQNYSVELYTSSGDGFLSGIEGVERFNNFYFRSNLRFITFFSFFLSQLMVFFVIMFKRKRENSLMYINTVLPFSGILAARLMGLPVVVHVHEDRVSPRKLNDLLFYIVNRFTTQIILVSKYLKKNHINTAAKVDVIYNAVSLDFESYHNNGKNVSKGDFNVLMLSSLRPYKGVGEFLALAKLLPDVTFTLVLSESTEDVSEFFSKITVPKNINIFPIQKNVHVFYRQASLVINLSDKDVWVETFGMTVLEAMNYALPVIVPKVGGITELVREGENGFLIDSKDTDGLVDKITLLASDSDIWMKMSKRSLEFSRQFSSEQFKIRLSEVLSKYFPV